MLGRIIGLIMVRLILGIGVPCWLIREEKILKIHLEGAHLIWTKFIGEFRKKLMKILKKNLQIIQNKMKKMNRYCNIWISK